MPRILVPGRTVAAGRAGRQATVVAGLGYLEAIATAGGLEMVVGARALADDAAADALVTQAHGVLLLGGPDVDPARYGQEPHPRTYGVDGDHDEFEIAVLRAAVRNDLPVLAICRGLQLVNVAYGGTLEQHLEDRAGRLAHAAASFPTAVPGAIGPLLPIEIEPGCRLHRLLGDPAAVNRGDQPLTVTGAHSHHQAVACVGAGLLVVGRSADGVIEALEHSDRWLVAAQWHPEDTARDDPSMRRLFAGFVAEAATRR